MGVEVVVGGSREEETRSLAAPATERGSRKQREREVRISVAMVTYNGEAYLREQMESILNQLGERDELVISDDGSKDHTLEIIREYQAGDSRIRFFSGPGRGIKKNVEHALTQTRGAYIFLADQDDIWLPGKTAKMLEAFGKSEAMVAIHDARVFEGEDPADIVMESFYQFRNSGAGVWKNLAKNSYIGCCMAFRRELKELILPIPNQIEMHDQWIGILGDYVSGKSCFLPEALLLYRRHGDNNSSMKHYGIGKMLRNRLVFFSCFFVRIVHFRQKRNGFLGNFKKNNG